MTKAELIHIWKEQCLTVRVVSKNKFEPTVYRMSVLGHDNNKQSVKEIKIMKGDKYYWISANYVQKETHYLHKGTHINFSKYEYIPNNDTFELTEKEYKELEELIEFKGF